MLDEDDERAPEGLGDVCMRSAALPEGVRVAPSFLRSGRVVQLSRNVFCVASGARVMRIVEDEASTVQPAEGVQQPTQPTVPMGPLRAFDGGIPHKAHVADIAVHRAGDGGGGLLASIDEIGGIFLSKIPASGDGSWGACAVRSETFNDGESGWGGVAFDQGGSLLAAVRGYQRVITAIDVQTQSVVRTMHTLNNPARACFVRGVGGGQTILAVAENNQVSLWDVRASERRGCIERLMPGAGAVNAIATAEGILGCAGADRSVYSYDSRKWAVRARAMGVLRSEANFLAFSRVDPSMYYVTGLDSTLVCGQLDAAGSGVRGSSIVPVSTSTGGHQGTHVVPGGSLRKVFEFRANGRWVACDMMPSSDSFAGICDQGRLYSLPDYDPLGQVSAKKRKTA